MKSPPIEEADALWEDWFDTFPPLSEETATAILHFVKQMASLLERRYGAQIRSRQTRPTDTSPF